jgi:hypothetical protein
MQYQQTVTNSANAAALDGDLYVCMYVITHTHTHSLTLYVCS